MAPPWLGEETITKYHSFVNTLKNISPAPPLAESRKETGDVVCSEGKKTYEEAKKFLQDFIVNTETKRLTALEALFDADFPRFENADIGKLLWRNGVLAPATYKSYGSRIYRKLRKTKGKKWE